jgi:hypothetical protein
VNFEEDSSGLRSMTLFAPQELHEINPRFEHCHEVCPDARTNCGFPLEWISTPSLENPLIERNKPSVFSSLR